jgi:hypothetical protein
MGQVKFPTRLHFLANVIASGSSSCYHTGFLHGNIQEPTIPSSINVIGVVNIPTKKIEKRAEP